MVQNERAQPVLFPFQHFHGLKLLRHSCVPCEAQKHCLAADSNDYNELDVFLAPDRCSIIVLMIVSTAIGFTLEAAHLSND